MALSEENIRLIFGLKLKQLRKRDGSSLQELADRAGLSVSYLNEIEKGKKYPKNDKILALANALDADYDKLVSTRLGRQLEPLNDLFASNIFNDIPLQTFGISREAIINMMAGAPARVNAFIGAIAEIARNYNMRQEHFYFTALRMLQEMEDNYFEAVEDAVDDFRADADLGDDHPLTSDRLARLLRDRHGYDLVATDFAEHPPLRTFRSIYRSAPSPVLYYNTKLSEQQQAFLFGKELGFVHMDLDERPVTSSWLEVENFDQVDHNFRASYFACSLLIPRRPFLRDLEAFFARTTWSDGAFLDIMHRYGASPEMFMHRLTNLLPRHFGMKQLFFIRYSHGADRDRAITKELHLSRHMRGITGDMDEINYRRWMTRRILAWLERKRDREQSDELLVNAVRSRFTEGGHEYFCISITRPRLFVPGGDAVTIGFVLTDAVRRKLAFLDDEDLYFLQPDEAFMDEMDEPEDVRRRAEVQAKRDALADLLDEPVSEAPRP